MKPSEELATWYFRLNGFLTIPNFILHPLKRGGQRTDFDVIGVRFPYRREFEEEHDEPEFQKQRPYLIFVEVKTGEAEFNKAWTESAKGNLSDVLQAVGMFPPRDNGRIAEQLSLQGWLENEIGCVSLLAIGERLATSKGENYREAPHRTWDQILHFIFNRFEQFGRVKTDNEQWDTTGKDLWDLYVSNKTFKAFSVAARRKFLLARDRQGQ